jgi:hypothetical protein
MSWISRLTGLDKNPKTLAQVNGSFRTLWALGGNTFLETAFRKAAKRAGLTTETADMIWKDVEGQVRSA